MAAQAEARGMAPHGLPAVDHTHILPGKKSEMKAKGGSSRIGEFGPVERRGSCVLQSPLAPQPVNTACQVGYKSD
jgi:hypothetical protein